MSEHFVAVVDNRGSDDHPFGFVYLNDKRIMFSETGLSLSWGKPTREEYSAMIQALKQEKWVDLIKMELI